MAQGYTGADLTLYAQRQGLSPRTVRGLVTRLRKSNPHFQQLKYLGKRTPDFTLDDELALCEYLNQVDFVQPSKAVAMLNIARKTQGRPPIPLRSAFKIVEARVVGLSPNRKDPFSWFQHAGIPVTPAYDPAEARATLESHFTWSDLSTPYGLSIRKTLARITDAEACFARLYPGLLPHARYEEIRHRAASSQAFLSSITLERGPAIVARLTFECQVLWLGQARDLLVDRMRLRMARLRQEMRAKLPSRLNVILQERLDEGARVGQIHLDTETASSKEVFQSWIKGGGDEKDRVRAQLRLEKRDVVDRLFTALSTLTHSFHPEEIIAHTPRTRELLVLAREPHRLDALEPEGVGCLGRNSRLLKKVTPERRGSLARFLLTERLLDAINQGSITLPRVWGYQELGARISAVPLPKEEEWPLPRAKLQSLLDGSYKVDLSPLVKVCNALKKREVMDDEDAKWFPRFTKEGYTELAEEVHRVVLEHHPDWFATHQRTLEGVWDGMFRMEYLEDHFTSRLQIAIGYLGRNCRMRDDLEFFPLLHFLRRYVTMETLRLELRLLHDTLREITAGQQRVCFVDTSGVEGRRTHPLSLEHPRYHTRGVADLRGIGEGLVPLYSMPCPSTDTEAMHAVELVSQAREVAGDGILLYGGNGHTVSRVSTALVFGTFGVVSAGHVVHEPKSPGPRKRERLQRHLGTLNKVFLLMRQKPELGSPFSSRSHVYVDGVSEW